MRTELTITDLIHCAKEFCAKENSIFSLAGVCPSDDVPVAPLLRQSVPFR